MDNPIPGLKHVIPGRLDDIAPAGPIQSAMPQWSADAELTIIDGADHFYGGQLHFIESSLLSFS